jgi:hypothetical protein
MNPTKTKRSKTKSLLLELLLWYPLSAPWLLVRTPLLYLFFNVLHMPLWVAVALEFVIERPLFFLTARAITLRVEKTETDESEAPTKPTNVIHPRCQTCGAVTGHPQILWCRACKEAERASRT